MLRYVVPCFSNPVLRCSVSFDQAVWHSRQREMAAPGHGICILASQRALLHQGPRFSCSINGSFHHCVESKIHLRCVCWWFSAWEHGNFEGGFECLMSLLIQGLLMFNLWYVQQCMMFDVQCLLKCLFDVKCFNFFKDRTLVIWWRSQDEVEAWPHRNAPRALGHAKAPGTRGDCFFGSKLDFSLKKTMVFSCFWRISKKAMEIVGPSCDSSAKNRLIWIKSGLQLSHLWKVTT